MKKSILTAIVALGIPSLLLTSVYAGYSTSVGQHVEEGGWVRGVLRKVRDSSNSIEYIGCKSWEVGNGPARVSCFARTESGLSRTCSTSVAGYADVAASIGEESLVSFSFGYPCGDLEVHTMSQYLTSSGTAVVIGY